MSNKTIEFGILILGFNRPELLNRTLSALADTGSLKDSLGFFSLDGPRDGADVETVKQCQDVFSNYEGSFKETVNYFSYSNLGLRDKVMQSVTKAFERVDKLMVLEDDCVVGETTIDYFSFGFNWLQSQLLGVISGNYLGRARSEEAFLAKRFGSWGWGTNASTWNRFRLHAFSQKPLVELKPEIHKLTSTVPLPYRYEYKQMSLRLDELNSWAIPFDMFLRSEGIKTLKPTRNQIQNIGFGSESTHTSRGLSLSIPTQKLDIENLVVADEKISSRIEKQEAWTKFSLLAKELIFSRNLHSPISRASSFSGSKRSD